MTATRKPSRYINEDVDEIESQVFDSTTAADHSERIYKLKREIAQFRRAVLPLSTPLQRLAEGRVPGIKTSQRAPYFRDVHDHVLRAADAIEGHDRLLSDVLQADLARVTARQSEMAVRQNETAVRQNEDMRKISAWAAIALLPTAVAGIYGMNFDNMPELHWKSGYFLMDRHHRRGLRGAAPGSFGTTAGCSRRAEATERPPGPSGLVWRK